VLLLCGGGKRTKDAEFEHAKKLAGDWRQQGKTKPTADAQGQQDEVKYGEAKGQGDCLAL
jgi:hypothetical protein